MKVDSHESFDGVMRSRILPLRTEYFYNDWEGLCFVLKENGSNGGLIRGIEEAVGMGRNRWQWYHDAGVNGISPAEVLLKNFNSEVADGE